LPAGVRVQIGRAQANAADAGIAVLAGVQRESRQTASALDDLNRAAAPKPGVGGHINVFA
jgi:hypothetical protein